MQDQKRASIEFGDFQTPTALASEVVNVLDQRLSTPSVVIEPTCGTGSFLYAAGQTWPTARLMGFECNEQYLIEAEKLLRTEQITAELACRNFFDEDWRAILHETAGPVLLLGNPPWVTNASLSGLGSSNLPQKTNFQSRKGFDAKTGKANFDISEWMVIRLLEAADSEPATIAMLLKYSVARKVLTHAWKTRLHLKNSEIRLIDAKKHFGASVAGCLFVASLAKTDSAHECSVFASIDAEQRQKLIGWRDGFLVADAHAYDRSRHLWGSSPLQWRSGIKHDCAKVMEFWHDQGGYRNGYGEIVELESKYLYPFLKTSDVVSQRLAPNRRCVLVTQREVGDDTAHIASDAPKTWAYLTRHSDKLDKRGSSIYRKRPQFSIFGVGPYSFKPWKVAISGFYKQTQFTLVPPINDCPAMVDDATYFVSFTYEETARLVSELLNSAPAQDLLASMIFMDAKRPITAELLQRMDLRKIAEELGRGAELGTLLRREGDPEQQRTEKAPLFPS
jgi:hypothetical protein